MTKRYCKKDRLELVLFNKGICICIIRLKEQQEKFDKIAKLRRFEKVIPIWKNAKYPVYRGKEEIMCVTKTMTPNEKIEEKLFDQLRHLKSQITCVNCLTKIYKIEIVLRPLVSMFG